MNRAKDAAILDATHKAEKLRVDEVRARGWDRLDLSVSGLREIPTALFRDDEATSRLAYVVGAFVSTFYCCTLIRCFCSKGHCRFFEKYFGFFAKSKLFFLDD
jgi:hypothetical protein